MSLYLITMLCMYLSYVIMNDEYIVNNDDAIEVCDRIHVCFYSFLLFFSKKIKHMLSSYLTYCIMLYYYLFIAKYFVTIYYLIKLQYLA